MRLDTTELLHLLADVSLDNNLKVTVHENHCTGVFVVLLGSLIGFLLMGPPGFVVGTAVCSVLFLVAEKTLKPVSQILLNELTIVQQALLVNRVKSIARSEGAEDVSTLTTLVLGKIDDIEEQLVGMVANFVQTELNLTLA